ncbi:MAG: P-loop containing nucleoside triphosphate hydrolase protein [Monoraphidium minutum]|nr:MAG: P-loop containing nucleoside triphosphate hydrolase protein [Monoraphidium minutum]
MLELSSHPCATSWRGSACLGAPRPHFQRSRGAGRGWRARDWEQQQAATSVRPRRGPPPAAAAHDAPSTSGRTAAQELGLATAGEDTIAAVVTGVTNQGSVAIIRISGPDAAHIAARVFWPGGRFKFGWAPESHRVYYGTVVDGGGGVIDEAVLVPMLAPRSYTREDVIELQVHGGPVCCRRVLTAAIEAGARPAKPGEFTLRAFLNGRLDLSQAEAVMQLVNARTAAAADSALAGLQGGVGGAVRQIREDVLDILVEVEARIDFEEDLGPLDVPSIKEAVASLQRAIEAALRTARQGALLRNGLQVAIVGRPNVGKSSLLNAWTRTDRAIVTDIAGTTRDVLEADLVVGGVPLTLLDTAGIRDSTDEVEAIGVERSQAAASNADIVLMVIDAAAGWSEADQAIFAALWGKGPGTRSCRVKGMALLVANKADLAGEREVGLPLPVKDAFQSVVRTCAVSRTGLGSLEEAILQLAGAPQLASGGVSWSVNERQADALVRAHEALMGVAQAIADDVPYDCWTIDLRSAAIALGEVSGDEVAEEVLDSVFARFCLGK